MSQTPNAIPYSENAQISQQTSQPATTTFTLPVKCNISLSNSEPIDCTMCTMSCESVQSELAVSVNAKPVLGRTQFLPAQGSRTMKTKLSTSAGKVILNSDNNKLKGYAALLGDEGYMQSRGSVASSMQMVALHASFYKDKPYKEMSSDKLLSPPSSNDLEQSRVFYSANFDSRSLVTNRFPVIAGDRVLVASVSRTGYPISIDKTLITYNRCTINTEEGSVTFYFGTLNAENASVIMDQAITTAMAIQEHASSTNNPHQEAWYTVLCGISFTQGSFGAAVTACCYGVTLRYPITGAITIDGVYMPDKTDLKLKAMMNLNEGLYICGEYDDFEGSPSLQTNFSRCLVGQFIDPKTRLPLNPIIVTTVGTLLLSQFIAYGAQIRAPVKLEMKQSEKLPDLYTPVIRHGASVKKAKEDAPPLGENDMIEWHAHGKSGELPLAEVKAFSPPETMDKALTNAYYGKLESLAAATKIKSNTQQRAIYASMANMIMQDRLMPKKKAAIAPTTASEAYYQRTPSGEVIIGKDGKPLRMTKNQVAKERARIAKAKPKSLLHAEPIAVRGMSTNPRTGYQPKGYSRVVEPQQAGTTTSVTTITNPIRREVPIEQGEVAVSEMEALGEAMF